MVFRSGSREGEIESRSENNKGSFPFALTTCIAPEPAFVSQTCLMLAIFGQSAKWHNTGFSRYCGLFEGAGMQKIAWEFVCEVKSCFANPGALRRWNDGLHFVRIRAFDRLAVDGGRNIIIGSAGGDSRVGKTCRGLKARVHLCVRATGLSAAINVVPDYNRGASRPRKIDAVSGGLRARARQGFDG